VKLLAALASAAATLSLALAPAATAQDKPGPFAGGRMVGLGSSFAAGSGFGPLKPDTPQRCGRSIDNYATLVAEKLRMLLVDVACGGATTAHVLGPWNELPPQIDAVTADTALVTITVGGNDIGYVGYLIAQSCKVRGPIALGAAGTTCPEVPVPGEETWFRLENNLKAIAGEVRRRAPQARLVFVQYLGMVPTFECAESPLSPEAAREARAIATRLAQVTERAARQSGAMVIDLTQPARKRLPCGGPTAWVAGWPAGYKQGDTFPWHPTRVGHDAIAQEIVKQLGGS
jgi:lysophospholipase L1-like esterase